MQPVRTKIQQISLLGNYLPRRCGIATFTTDLTEAITHELPAIGCGVVAMNDPGMHHAYGDRVRFEIAQNDLAAYRRAADFLNAGASNVLSVQHEYGIFGGKAGGHLLVLLRELRMPIVTTLHTILREPNVDQRRVMNELLRISTRVVVMSQHGADLLRTVHDVPESKIDLIPHGIPDVPSTSERKALLGLEGKSVILTFGLLSPDKGIEFVVGALPRIAERHPSVVYVVLGATHPHVKERAGESYRRSLELLARRSGVAANLIFHDRFVSLPELVAFLSAADIYVTPYLNPEQVTSGTLAYAVGAGKAVVSTPYIYARELLADGRGILVPSRDSNAMADAINGLLGDPDEMRALGTRAALFGRDMLWPTVARRHIESLERACVEHANARRAVFQAKTVAARPMEVPELNIGHLRLMTDSTALIQHAAFSIPRYEDGYCVDDNARALLFLALSESSSTADPGETRLLASRYFAFVNHAFNKKLGRFRNFMSYGREWTEECGSEDSHGRAIWALGGVVGHSRDPGRQNLGGELFHAALPAVESFRSPRAWAFVLLGIREYVRAYQGDSRVESIREKLSGQLLSMYQRTSRPDWPWFEGELTYDNARLSQALIASASGLANDDMTAVGLRSLEWLAKVQCSEKGYFAPVGSNGFWERGGVMARFDQQPLEACAMVSACLDAWQLTSDEKWAATMRRAFSWFLGQNDLDCALYDPATGGCRDGLHADRPNENQGAESTLSFLLAQADISTLNSEVRRQDSSSDLVPGEEQTPP